MNSKRRARLLRLLPSVRSLLIDAGICAMVAVESAVDGVQIGPGLYVSAQLSDPATVAIAAGVLVIFAAMLVAAWLHSRHLRALREQERERRRHERSYQPVPVWPR